MTPKLKLKSKQGIIRISLWIVLIAVLIWSIYAFLGQEGSRFLKLIILLLAIWAGYLAIRGKKEFLIILSGFIATAYIFNLLDAGQIASWLATLIFILLYTLLFYLFHNSINPIYAGLAILIITEFSLILKLFPVDAKNRSIILILIFWYFNQVYYFHRQKKLDNAILINLTVAFLIIFGIIMYTLPFWSR